MWSDKKIPLVTIFVYIFMTTFYAAGTESTEQNAADLVLKVRENENWIHKVDSFYLQIQSKWERTPHGIDIQRSFLEERGFANPDPNFFPDLKPVSTDILELAIDGKKRLRYLMDEPSVHYSLKVWDGNEVIQYSNAIYTGDEFYRIDPNLGSEFASMFDNISWPRSQIQSYWWYPISIERRLKQSGRPEEFILSGQSNYHGVDCYVLDWKRNEVMSYRWYVGTADQRMYGYLWLMNGQPVSEHRLADYKEIFPGCWFPMSMGYDFYDNDNEGKHYLKFEREFKILQVTVNEKLPDELFTVQFNRKITVLDNRSGETIRYTYIPELTGKILPVWDSINIDISQQVMEGKALLVCLFDMEQRPSRNCILQLNEKTQELKSKDIEIVAVHASKIEQEKLDEWIKENEITFPIGMIEAEEENIRFNWGVKSLPWLILTDKNHVVTAEGFSINELDEKINL